MRCSSTSCGREGDGIFCEECGFKMVEENMDTVVICSGKLKNGSPCGNELVLGQKFCKYCGTKVDQALLTSLQNACPACGSALDQDAMFCTECGHGLENPTARDFFHEKEVESANDVGKRASKPGLEPNTEEKRNQNMQNESEANISKPENFNQSKVQMSENYIEISTKTTCEHVGENVSLENPDDDVEMVEDKSEFSTKEDKGQSERSRNQRGNISIIHESSNTDLSEQLKEVHIVKDKQGNLNVVDSTQPSSNNEDRMESKGELKGGDETEETVEVFNNGNGQIKRSMNQKENEKKRKQEGEINTYDKDNDNVLNAKGPDSQEIQNISEQTSQAEMSEEIKSEVENDSTGTAEDFADKSNVSNTESDEQTETVDDSHDKLEQSKENDTTGTGEDIRDKSSIFLSADAQTETEAESQGKSESAKENDSTGTTEDIRDYGDVLSTDAETEAELQGKIENSKENNTTGTTKDLKDNSNVLSTDAQTEHLNNSESSPGTSSVMVFGGGTTKGIQETGENNVRAPFGKSLFTLNNNLNTGEGSADGQNRDDVSLNNNQALSSQDNDLKADDSVVYSNDFTEDYGDRDKDGTDVDKPNGMETRRMAKMKSAEQNKKQQDQLKKQGKTEDSKVKTAQRKFNEKCIKVQFHVLTSEDFKFDPEKDKCIVMIGNEDMGGWKKTHRIMKEKRKIDNYIYEMVYEEVIPTRLISGGPTIPYKYMIIKSDKQDEERWEHYLKNYKYGKDCNRDLKVHMKLKGLDVWHQFDCFMEYESQSKLKKFVDFFTWKTNLIKHAERAAEIFCPVLIEHDKSITPVDDIVLQLKMLSECMKKIYMIDGRCYLDNKDFSKNISTFITETLMKKATLEQVLTVETNEKIGKKERATTAALTFLIVMKSMELNMPDSKSVRALTKALIVSPVSDQKECPELQLAYKLFSGKRKLLLDAILAFIKNVSCDSKDPCWLCLMPWVHFLSDECVPFQAAEVDLKHDQSQPIWWGVAAIDKDLDIFKKKHGSWSIPVDKMLTLLQPLFKMDYLLPRTFIASVDLEDLKKVIESREIPMEACLAHLTYRLKVTKPEIYYEYGMRKVRENSYAEQTVHTCIDSLLKQLQETFFSADCDLSQWTMSYIIASHMLKRSIENKRLGTMQLCTQAFIHCIAMYDRILAEKATEHKETKHHSSVLQENAKEVIRMLESYQRWDIEMKDILDVWNNVFAPVVLQSDEVKNTWNKIISEGFVQNLQRKVCLENHLMQKFVELYCQKIDGYNLSMQECMGRVAFLVIAKGYTWDYIPYQNIRFGGLLSELFISEWRKNVKMGKEEEITMLRHLLRWPPLSQYLKMYYKDEKKQEMLTEDCLQHLIQAVSAIEIRFTALLSGALTIGEFNLITEKDDKFSELAELVMSKKEHTAAFVKKAIEIRKVELGAFQSQAEQMTTLATVCTHLANVDTKCIDDTLRKRGNIDIHQIKEFCVPADITEVDIIETYQPTLCAFKVSPTVMTVVPSLHACYKSSTFLIFWKSQCNKVHNQCATLDDVLEKVWNVVKESYDTVRNTIRNGEIKFSSFERVIGNKYRDNYDQMKEELRTMDIPEKFIGDRVHQLTKYRHLEACVKGAKTMLKFAKEYKLKGDFKQIRIIANHGDNDQKMKAFDNSVMKACEFLKELTSDKEKCLDMFVQCGPLVKWLKESMHQSGLKELKVFVDLALLSAGDEPINIARVQCLHSAVTGYAPLIFDLDESCGYKELLNLCSVVWKELDANPKLPDKLQDTNRQLQWLKEVKKAHGSVEVTSLMQAEAINANGIFTVGKYAWKKNVKTQIDETLMELKDTLKLTVPEQEGKRELRNYTFSQLQDLQSRLMLVAGKTEKGTDSSVDRFTMIFDSITRLSSVYIKLCSSGCVLFKDWTARFLCDQKPDRPVCAVLEFGQGRGAPEMKGRKSKTEDLKDMIPELANFMETCLDEWLEYIKKKRKSYLHLNYFTVDQLVILQRELVKMGSESEPSHLVYPLLSAVKYDCTPDDLLEAMTAAKEEIDGETNMEAERYDDTDDEEKEQAEDSTEDEKKIDFIRALVEAGYKETLAVQAAEHLDTQDVTTGILWCIDHEESSMSDDLEEPVPETNEPMREQLTQHPTFSGWSQSQTDIQTMITANITGLGEQKYIY